MKAYVSRDDYNKALDVCNIIKTVSGNHFYEVVDSDCEGFLEFMDERMIDEIVSAGIYHDEYDILAAEYETRWDFAISIIRRSIKIIAA